ncbi:uncharacterized protein LOC124112899 [Haliotis rufescens]|uniref:uncharacterized protein LOC124112899 n=1 Tax=Haliotis rufescens TaxID=6454 RepID=UPI00201F0976|nr:uncharacterized protein LOC124112899 [Haliotis rufescens]
MTMLSSTMGKYTLKGVLVFLALVGLVVAPASVSRGYGTMCVVEEDTNRVLMQYDVIMFQVLMSRSSISLEQEVSQSWSRISTYEEASTLLKLQRKLEGENVLQTLVVINTQPELLNNDLIQRALLKVQTTLEEEEELLEMHFGKKTSPSKHVVLTSDAFQSLRTQLQRSASEADEDQTLHSAESPSKLVEVSGQCEPQLQNLLAAYAQARLLDQQLQLMKEMVRKFDGPLDFNSRNEASPISRVVLTKDAFQSLLRQLKLDTTPDEKEDDESSQSLEVEVSGSKLVLSEDQTASPLMLQKEIFSKMVSQTMNALHGQSGFQDQLKMLEGVLDQKSQQSLEKTESPSKLIAPVTFQRQFLSKMVSQTLDALYGQSGFQDQLKMLEGVLDQKSQQSLEKTESPSKLIAPVTFQRQFLSKMVSQTLDALYGQSGFQDQLKMLEGVLDQKSQQSLEKTESPSKLIATVTFQRQFLSKMVSQTLDALYGQSGFQDQLKMLEGVLDQKSQQSLEKTESPSKLIAPVTFQRQFLSKMVSQTLDALYGQSGFQDQLKMLDGMLDRMKYPREAAFQSFNDLHQDVWLSREATRERTVQGQTSAAQNKSMLRTFSLPQFSFLA